MIELKPGVELMGLQPQMLIALRVLECLYQELGRVLVITSGSDGTHTERSEHYAGRALDVRTRDMLTTEVAKVATRAQQALGPSYAVLIESDHIHVHYRPVRRSNLQPT